MTDSLAMLPSRAVLELTGADRVAFLQGLVSNDVTLAAPGRAVWAALLTPQGKWLTDFFIFAEGDALLLDAEADGLEALAGRLRRFRLRAKVDIAARADLAVMAGWNGYVAPPGAIAAPDPRLEEAGIRMLVHADAVPAASADFAAWDAHRLRLGLPDGARDLEAEKTVLLEAGFDALDGISWTKGCYMGQELTARTRYRGLLKRRLVPVAVEGTLPPPGTPILREGVEMGTLRSGLGGQALALLRLEALTAGLPLQAGAARLTPRIPGWMAAPAP
ncbi:MAG: folate-binding protein YgfZ [Rhodospirillales bacterium]|nr:folate-binding protein YgfZ [Rhodospirillales bacterium]